MQKYPVRTSSRANLSLDALAQLCQSHFERAEKDGNAVKTSWGALAALKVWPEGKELAVDMTMNPKVDGEVAAATIQRYNGFLQEATGYSSKERASRLRKAAAKGADGA